VLDEHLSNTRPGYAAYRARVPGFLPALRPLTRDG
jgi:steroid 5-alpha reductase family enzyme